MKTKKRGLINQLNLFLNENDLIERKGRLDHSELPLVVKTPILLNIQTSTY